MATAGRSSELKLFEALESYTNNDSFCSKASFVQNFLQCELDLNNTQQSIQIDDILEEEDDGIQERSVTIISDGDSSSYISICSDDDEEEEEDLGNSQTKTTDVEHKNNAGVKLIGKGRNELLSLLLRKYGDKQRCEEGVGENSNDESRLKTVDEEDDDEVEGDGDDMEQRMPEGEKGIVDEPVVERTKSKQSPPVIVDEVENWTQYFQILEVKRQLEEQQQKLTKEKECFEKIKATEESRMKEERKRVESQRKSLQNLIADYHKIKFSREEYEQKIKELSDQLKDTKLQMNKRISRWGDQQRRLEERVKTLEKENEELKKSQPRSLPQRLANLKRPPMRCIMNNKKQLQKSQSQQQPLPPRRVQFADDCDKNQEDDKENESLKTNSRDSSSSSYFSTTLESESSFPKEKDKNSNSSDSSGGEQREPDQDVKEVHLSDDEADKTMPADYMEVKHPCGTITRVTKDNQMTRYILINNDVMDVFDDSSVRYYYRELGFSQISYPNGDEIFEYDSGEIETRRADGSKIFTYSNGLVKMVDGASGSEEVIFGDGSIVKKSADGESTVITWPSGQKEVRTANFVKRIYTNGTVKIMYKDGSEETRYFNGRVRRKDKNGVLVDDSKKSKSK